MYAKKAIKSGPAEFPISPSGISGLLDAIPQGVAKEGRIR
jgi:hypothetical protein